MSLLSILPTGNLVLTVTAIGIVVIVLQALYTRYHGGLNAIPGPFSASFCNYWRAMAVYKSDMPRRNIAVHQKYGPVVRIGPKCVSFAGPEALVAIHASRQAFPKSDFYKPTVHSWEGEPLLNLFSVQDVEWHSSLKKTIGTLYTKSSVLSLEPKIDGCVTLFMNKLRDTTTSGTQDVDMSLWVHLFTFDTLGEINASKDFGFVRAGKDFNGLIGASDRILIKIGLFAQAPVLQLIRRIRERNLSGVARRVNPVLKLTASLVEERLEKPTKTPDMLNKFLELREANPEKLSMRKIIGSLYINLMAGHDVLAVSLRAILYYVARNSSVERKLRSELAAVHSGYPEAVPYEELAKLPYLDAVIQESLRIHSNLGLINERVVPPEGAVIEGYHLPGGTIVGVNPWVIHRNTEIFGEDVETFRPERWLEGDQEKIEVMRRNLFSFGAGPRMCIGKNIAMMQICKFVAEFYRRFDAKLTQPERQWQYVGNWVTKQTDMDMLVTARQSTVVE